MSEAPTRDAPEQGPNPYPGPKAIEFGESLFGRDTELDELSETLIAHRIVLLHSPSGAGKTSLVDAGLRPLLLNEGFEVIGPLRVGLRTSGADGAQGNRYLASVLAGMPVASGIDVATSGVEAFHAYLDSRRPDPVVLVFDQFEEILSSEIGDERQKAEFLREVGVALQDSSRWALFSMRDDYVAALDPYLHLIPTRLNSRFPLDLLRPPRAIEAIEGPAREARRPFERAASEALVTDLRQVLVADGAGRLVSKDGPFVDPLHLQLVCRNLWESTAGRGSIQVDDLSHTDGYGASSVEVALSAYYESEVEAISRRLDVPEYALRDWFDSQLIVDGHRGQTLQGPRGVPPKGDTLMARLIGSHLVRETSRAETMWFELAHDRLIEPISQANRAWRKEHGPPFARAAELWDEAGRPQAALLTGPDLEEMQEALVDRRPSTVEAAFLAASQAADQERVKDEERARRVRSLVIVGGAAVIVVMAVIAAGWFWIQQQAADDARQLARSNELAVEALLERDTDPVVAMLLGVEANDLRTRLGKGDSAEAMTSLLSLVAPWPAIESILGRHEAPVATVAVEATGMRAASGDGRGELWLWSRQDRAGTQLLQAGEGAGIWSVAFHPGADPAPLAAGTGDGGVLVWDLRVAAAEPIRLEGLGGRVVHTRFSSDGSKVGAVNELGAARTWDWSTGSSLESGSEEASPRSGRVSSVAFSPDLSRFARGYSDGHIELLDTTSGEIDEVAASDSDAARAAVTSLAFGPVEGRMASGHQDGTVAILDTETGTSVPLDTRGAAISELAFRPDGTSIVARDARGTVTTWDTIQRRQIGTGMPTSLDDRPSRAAFGPGASFLVSGDDGGDVVLWDLATRSPFGELLSVDSAPIIGVALDSTGATLVSASSATVTDAAGDSTRPPQVTVWDQDTKSRTPYPIPLTQISRLAMSPDGSSLALAGSRSDATRAPPEDVLLLMSLDDGGTSELKIAPGQRIASLAFSPKADQTLLAVGDAVGDIHLWDIATAAESSVLDGGGGAVAAMAFSGDGGMLAAGFRSPPVAATDEVGADAVLLWDMQSSRDAPKRISLPGVEITSLAFDQDDQTLIIVGTSVSPDAAPAGAVATWAHRSATQASPVPDATTPMGAIVSDPRGNSLFGGTRDGTVVIWDAEEWRPLGVLTGHTGLVTGLVVDAEKRKLITAGSDGKVIAWDIDPRSWRDTLCDIVGPRSMSQRDLDEYFPEERTRTQICEEV